MGKQIQNQKICSEEGRGGDGTEQDKSDNSEVSEKKEKEEKRKETCTFSLSTERTGGTETGQRKGLQLQNID